MVFVTISKDFVGAPESQSDTEDCKHLQVLLGSSESTMASKIAYVIIFSFLIFAHVYLGLAIVANEGIELCAMIPCHAASQVSHSYFVSILRPWSRTMNEEVLCL